MRKILLSLIMLCTLYISVAQINFNANFDANATGWTGNITRTTATTACGTPSMRRNLYNTVTTGNMVSPSTGTANALPHTLTYKYKVADWSANMVGTANGWGSFNVQIGATATGPWTTIQTIDASNHTVSGTCATQTVTFTPPAGPLFVKWDVVWAAGDYYINYDDVALFEISACAFPTALNNTNVTTTTATHSWAAATGATGYQWAVTTSATPPATGTATTALTASSTTLTPNTTYYLHVRTACGSTFSPWSTSSTFFTGYCQVTGTSVLSYFDAFSTTGGTTNISNAASGYSTVGYGNFITQKVTQQQGSSVGFAGTLVVGDEGVGIWVDYNDNLVFETTERMYTSNAYLTTLSGSFVVPATAPVGNHRMRIVMDYNSQNPSPCSLGAGRGEVEDYTLEVIPGTACTGAPTGVAITPVSTVGCTSATLTFTATTTSPGTGITYQWQSSPTGANTFTNISGATATTYTATGVTTSTDFRCVLTCSGAATNSNIAIVTISASVANDLVCNAIPLTLNATPVCGNTTCATSAGDPTFSSSAPNNTVWHAYTPTVSGPVEIVMSRPAGVTSGLLNAWVGIYTATGTCPTLTLTEVTPALANFDLTTSPTVTVATGTLTAGTTYYFMVDGFSGSFGAYCIKVQSPPAPPACLVPTDYLAPTNGQTGVAISPNVTFTWNNVPTATGYDIYLQAGAAGTIPTTLFASNFAANAGATTTGTWSAAAFGTTYVWYVVPRNSGGAAVGCGLSNSFTTIPPPNNCVPTYSNSCASSDIISEFAISDPITQANSINNSSVCNATATVAPFDNYTNFTTTVTTIPNLVTGATYTGAITVETSGDYATIWIDYNNDGIYATTERVLDRLPCLSMASTPFSIQLPSGITPNNNVRMRVRIVWGTAAIANPTDPCTNYAYGETEDYLVNIVAPTVSNTPSYAVSLTTPASCAIGVATTITPASNNASNWVKLLDTDGTLIAEVNANGNDLGRVTPSKFINTATIRQDAGVPANKYLDRNIAIVTEKQPTSPVGVRLYFKNGEKSILDAAVPMSDDRADINVTKIDGGCAASFGGANVTYLPQTGNAAYGSDHYIQVNTPSFSNFFLHKGTAALPVSLSNLRGAITGTSNTIYWSTVSESNSRKFAVQRSIDGNNFTTLGEVASQATNGNSNTVLNYTFIDVNPLATKAFYRLQMIDLNGASKISQIVTLKRGAVKLEIVDVRPNPTTNTVFFNVLGTSNNVRVTVNNLNGQQVLNKGLVATNNFSVNLSPLANGIYLLTATDALTNEKAIFKIVKQ